MLDIEFLILIFIVMGVSTGILYLCKVPILWIVINCFSVYFFLSGVWIDIQVVIWWIPYREEHITFLTAIWNVIFIPLTAEPFLIYIIAQKYKELKMNVRLNLFWTGLYVVGTYFFYCAMEDQFCKLLAENVLEWTPFQVEYYLIGIIILSITLYVYNMKKKNQKGNRRLSILVVMITFFICLGLTLLILVIVGGVDNIGYNLYNLAFYDEKPGIVVEGYLVMISFGLLFFMIGLFLMYINRKASLIVLSLVGIDLGFLIYVVLFNYIV